MSANEFTFMTVGSLVDETVGMSYTTDSNVDADALQPHINECVALWDELHLPTKFTLPAPGGLQNAVNHSQGFLCVEVIKIGET